MSDADRADEPGGLVGPDRGPAARGEAGRAAAGRSLAGRRRRTAASPRPDAERERRAPEDPEETARRICLDRLALSPRTRAELAVALAQADVPPEVAETVLDRFGEVGLIDDAAFAAAWVSSRHRGRGLARRALSHELRRRGVAAETAAVAIEELDPDLEAATARSLVERRLPATRGLDPAARARRLVGVLARKGYPAGTAYRVVREALEQEGEEVALDTDGLSALE